MDNFAAFTPTKFSLKMVQVLYNKTIYTMCTNTKYEGEITKEGDSVVVRTAGKVLMKKYTKGMTLVKETLTPTAETLHIDQADYFAFEVDDIDKIQNDIDAISTYATNAKKGMEDVIDVEILRYAQKNILGENLMGVDYAVGTVEVDAAGVVSGSGTTFTPSMVGGLFKAVGQTKYFVVDTFVSGSSITLKNQNGTDYADGSIALGTAYVIKGAGALTLTKANVYDYLVDLGTVLDEQNTPTEGRFLVINGKMKGIIRKSEEFAKADISMAYEGVIKKAHIGEIAGFQILVTENVQGDNTDGYWFWAGEKEFMTFAAQIIKTSVVPSEMSGDSFMTVCKGLLVFGRQVFDGNRGRGAFLRATIS